MPWTCCQTELQDDRQTCPQCGRSKALWTTRFAATRVFAVSLSTWVELELKDEAGQPLADAPYRIELPDGTVREGKLNAQGLVKVKRIQSPGLCRVWFPGFDRAELDWQDPALGPADSWIELELKDEDGRPLAGAAYRLEDPSGEVHEGVLDPGGLARVEGLRAGDCKLWVEGVDSAYLLPPAPPPAPPPETEWLELELVDEQGRPLAGEPYRLELPGGEVREGQLDRQGIARLADIPPTGGAPCKLLLPGIEYASLVVPGAPPPAPPPETAWVEVELIDDAGRPLAGERYRIEAPGGQLHEGVLDAQGLARLEGLPPGACTVTFPDIDARDGLASAGAPPAPPAPPPETAWVEVALADDAGRPLAGEPYRLETPDGQLHEGTLDAQGLARLEGVAPGRCKLWFPELDSREAQATVDGVLPPPPPAPETTWVEVALTDEAGRPLAGEPYRIEAPDGRRVEGVLDPQGMARLDGIPPGACKLWLLELDARDVRPAASRPPGIDDAPLLAPAETWAEV